MAKARNTQLVPCPYYSCTFGCAVEYSPGHNDPIAEIIAKEKLMDEHAAGGHGGS